MHEVLSAGNARNVVETFEPVAGPDAVQTPRQVSGGAGAVLGGRSLRVSGGSSASFPATPGRRTFCAELC